MTEPVQIIETPLTVEVTEASPLTVEIEESSGATVTVELPPTVETLEVSIPGPAGPIGPQGPVGLDLNYLHEQDIAAQVWVVEHDLGKYPSVFGMDTSGNRITGKVIYTSLNVLEIHHSVVVSGTASCN